MDKNKEFCTAVHQYVEYWEQQCKGNTKDGLTGLAFSILRLLDGLAPNFHGNLKSLTNENPSKLLHHLFRQTSAKEAEEK